MEENKQSVNQENIDTPPPLSRSSRFNILLMKRTNHLAIFIFLAGIIYKLIQHFVLN